MMFSSSFRQAVIDTYKGKCQYCNCGDANHIDHIVPKSKGGSNDLENLTLVCQSCNLRKSDIELPETYIGLLLGIAERKKQKILDLIMQKEKKEKEKEKEKENVIKVDRKPTRDFAKGHASTEKMHDNRWLEFRDPNTSLRTQQQITDSQILTLAGWIASKKVRLPRGSDEEVFFELLKDCFVCNRKGASTTFNCSMIRNKQFLSGNFYPSEELIIFANNELNSRDLKHQMLEMNLSEDKDVLPARAVKIRTYETALQV